MMLHYKRIGQGTPVLLIHGLFGNLDNLGRLARCLADTHDVISIDLPNHGQSPHIPNIDYPLLAHKVAQLLEHLHIDKIDIVGHSMGGKVAMQFALDYPRLTNALIVADIAPVTYTDRHALVFEALNAIDLTSLKNRAQAIEVLTNHGIDPGTGQFLLKNLAKNEDGFFWRCNIKHLQHSYTNIIAGPTGNQVFDGPALFIKGADSDYIIPDHRSQIMQYYPAACAKIIQGTGHWLHAEKPVSFNKIVTDFIHRHQQESLQI